MDGGNIKAVTTYGTKRITAYHILEQTLNQRVVKVFDTVVEDGKERPVLNVKETAIAQDRQELIKSKFADWLLQDIRPREYDGSHIRFVGMNPEITLRKHQVNAIAHVIYGGNTLLAHEVGAGKCHKILLLTGWVPVGRMGRKPARTISAGKHARAAQKGNGVSGNGMGTTRFVEYKIRYAGIILQNARQHIHFNKL